MPVVARSYDTKYGTVQLGFAYVQERIVTKLLRAVLKDVKYENIIEDILLVQVKSDGTIGLPYFVHAHWQEFSSSVQDALRLVDYKVIEVLLWDQALIEYEQEVELIDRELQRAAELKKYQLHARGTIDLLIANKEVKGTLREIEIFLSTIGALKRN